MKNLEKGDHSHKIREKLQKIKTIRSSQASEKNSNTEGE